MQQLDIFDDGLDVMLVNDLAEALADGALANAQAAADLQAWRARHAPAAAALWGREAAAAWHAQRLAAFARRAQGLPWLPTQAETHAVALWMAARQWGTALQALTALPSWRRQPPLLAWAAECRWRHDGPDAAWPLLAELAWLAPARLPAVVGAIGDARLTRWLGRMHDELDEDSAAWFPAWLLIEQPLLRLERQGRHHDVVAQRRILQGQHAGLLTCNMKTR
jgi:hypothetical protein